MKKITFCILMLLWICSNIQVVGQVTEPQIREDGGYTQKSEKQEKATLQGVWQLCREVVPTGQGQFNVQTGPYIKVLSSDMKFINMYVGIMNDRSVITALGTYKQTSNDTYVESVHKSVTDPELTGIESKLSFSFLTNDLLQIKYRMPGRPVDATEVWVRVVQPSRK